VHAHGTRANSNVLWAARSLKIPVIYTVHGWSFHPDQHSFTRRLRILGEKYLVSRTQLNISASVSNQQSGQKYISEFRSVVVNNGIDRTRFDPSGTYKDIRKEFGIASDVMLVLFLARFTSHKQPLALIEAFAAAVAKNKSLHLLMVGDGDQKETAVKRIDELGLKNKISLVSFRQDVPDILAAADIYVLPSLWEGLPIGLLEAMAMGKAVIGTRVDGTSEVIEDNRNGLMVETSDLVKELEEKLLLLAGDPELRKKLQQNAISAVSERFNGVSMTRQIEELYNRVLPVKNN
jgi:glycosyltransferase involved in cell wall biosynthesis